MKFLLFPTATLLAALSGPAVASVLLGEITRDYGTGSGRIAPLSLGAGSCDTLSGDFVTIRNRSGCGRFYDRFAFSDLLYEEITGFDLTLNFSHTNSSWFEHWAARPASSGSVGSNALPRLTRVGNTITTQTFAFNSTLDVFQGILDNRAFSLWFAHEGWGQQNFNLYSASLRIYGTPSAANDPLPIPEPQTLALLAIGILGLIGWRKMAVQWSADMRSTSW